MLVELAAAEGPVFVRAGVDWARCPPSRMMDGALRPPPRALGL